MPIPGKAESPRASFRAIFANAVCPQEYIDLAMTEWKDITTRISELTAQPFGPARARNIGGGCINATLELSDGKRRYFVKLNKASRLEMFQAEADGLAELAAAGSIRTPLPICSGIVGDQAYLVLEFIELGGGGDSAAAGRQLASLHQTRGETFGWKRDNTIGSTPQPNGHCADWIEFWREQRLGFQLQLASKNGPPGRLQQRGARLLELFPALIDHNPEPSLIHGDLWGGNLSYDRQGQPVIYDPATYYGDREAELAMTELFGGFGNAFYGAYQEIWPLNAGYVSRKTLYNLYHILNHFNMFGGGYGGQALTMIDRLLAELGH